MKRQLVVRTIGTATHRFEYFRISDPVLPPPCQAGPKSTPKRMIESWRVLAEADPVMDPEQAKFQPVETSLGNPIAFRLEVLNGRSQLNWAQRDPSIQNTRHERT